MLEPLRWMRSARVVAGLAVVAISASAREARPQAPSPAECASYQDAKTHIAAGSFEQKDVATQDAIIATLYDVISGPACQHRDWERFKSLFVPGGRLIPTVMGPDRKVVTRVMTPEEYATNSSKTLEIRGFFEKEVSRTGETFGAVTHAFSTYESRRKGDDAQPFARGINSIQLMNDGTRWWVVTVYWQAERPDTPIPPQYLKKPND